LTPRVYSVLDSPRYREVYSAYPVLPPASAGAWIYGLVTALSRYSIPIPFRPKVALLVHLPHLLYKFSRLAFPRPLLLLETVGVTVLWPQPVCGRSTSDGLRGHTPRLRVSRAFAIRPIGNAVYDLSETNWFYLNHLLSLAAIAASNQLIQSAR
jgi:hypothetical protein